MLASGDCITQETSSLVWMYMGMAVAENQLRPILCGLLAHLDSEHMPVWTMVISELGYLAAYFGRTPNEIFEPYWRKTAHLIVKHIADRPVVATAIADLFGTTAPELALHLQSQAIPYLLYDHQTAAIRKISEYRGDGDELWLTLLDKTNLMSILALWVRLPAESGALEDLMERFQAFSPRLGPATIREVMGAAAIPVLAELFIQLTYEAALSPARFPSVSCPQ